jgi:hypothetical protein
MKTNDALSEFLRGAPTSVAVDLRTALTPKLEAHEYRVAATTEGGQHVVLAIDGDRLTLYRHEGKLVDAVTAAAISGMTLTVQSEVIDGGGGMLTRSFVLEHPALPSGELKIDAYILGDDFEEEYEYLRKHLEPFLGRGCCV